MSVVSGPLSVVSCKLSEEKRMKDEGQIFKLAIDEHG